MADEEATRALASVLIGRLLTEGAAPAPTSVAVLPSFADTLRIARRQRVLPLLVDAVADGEIRCNDDQRSELEAAEVQVACSQVMIESRLLEVADAFAARGIPLVVLKGVAAAHLDYADPSLRQFGDVDILVEPDAFGAAIEVLRAEGWTPASAVAPAHLAFTHAFPMRHRAGGDIDVHQAMGPRTISVRFPAASLLERSVPLEICEVGFRALDPVDRLLHAVVHGGTSRGAFRRLSSVADVVVMAGTPGLATEAVDRACDARILQLLRSMIASSFAIAGADVPPEWAAALAAAADGRDRLFEWAYLGDRRRPALEEVTFLRDLGWARRWQYVSGYLRVDEAYARKHGRSGPRQQLRYVRDKLLGR